MAAAWSIPLNLIEAGMPIGWAVLLSLFIAVLIGAVNGVIIAFVEAPPLFVTLAASFVIYGVAFWIAPAWVVYAPKNAAALLYPGHGLFFLAFRRRSSSFWLRRSVCICSCRGLRSDGLFMRKATILKRRGLRVSV